MFLHHSLEIQFHRCPDCTWRADRTRTVAGAGVTVLAAIITSDSVDHLALEAGSEIYALVKAQWVILTMDENIKTSARNRLTGTVVRCQEGAVNTEIVIELAGGKTVVAIITNESVRELGLKEGVRATALIKASHIILAVVS